MSEVIAYHLVLTNYGFWLPNDPRGSWSGYVRSQRLFEVAGKATTVHTQRSVAHHPHNTRARASAKRTLARDPVVWTGEQAREAARGFKAYATDNDRPVHALAVMQDHAHLVVGRTELAIEKQAEQLKARATAHLNTAGLHPFADRPYANGRLPTPWARGCWSVYLRTPDDVCRAIEYVQQNPPRAGLRPQTYTWLTPFPA